MLVISTGIHKILVRIDNRGDPDLRKSDLGLRFLSRPFCRATNVLNFRTFTVAKIIIVPYVKTVLLETTLEKCEKKCLFNPSDRVKI